MNLTQLLQVKVKVTAGIHFRLRMLSVVLNTTAVDVYFIRTFPLLLLFLLAATNDRVVMSEINVSHTQSHE